MTSGYQALRESCAWFDLSARGKIFARGEDRLRLLHAMTTNHVQQLKPGQGVYAFFLSAQGRILGDVDLFCLEDTLLLDTEPETAGKLFQHLDKYIIADDVTLENETGTLATLEIGGPQSADILRKLGSPAPENDHDIATWDTELVARVTAHGGPGYRIFTPIAEKEEIVLALESAGVVRADKESWEILRLENARPRYGEDIHESNLPQETKASRALHFQKGCYLGQEIVERVRSRGHVNRLLVPLSLDATVPPAPGTKIMAGDKDAGEITSALYSPALQQVVALGYLRAEHTQGDSQLQVDGRPATLRRVT